MTDPAKPPPPEMCHLCAEEECSIVPAVATRRAALASLRSDVAAKDAEIERLRELLNAADDELKDAAGAVDEVDALKAQLAAAENRGFREAAEWLENYRVTQDAGGSRVVVFCQDFLRAEADRREGIENNNTKPEDGGCR